MYSKLIPSNYDRIELPPNHDTYVVNRTSSSISLQQAHWPNQTVELNETQPSADINGVTVTREPNGDLYASVPKGVLIGGEFSVGDSRSATPARTTYLLLYKDKGH